MSEIGVGVLGLGFMGRTHITAYRDAAAAGISNRLVAVCDRDERRLSGHVDGGRGNLESSDRSGERLFDPDRVAGTTDAAELFSNPDVELVSICTHTRTHVDLAVAALRAGKHVLVEKPVALTAAESARLAAAARESDRLCMPAMCMRFWPGWDWLKQRIDAGDHGSVRSATFRRKGSHPGWSQAFYTNAEESGGALFDLHVHDADFVRHCFGAPSSVTSTGDLDHVSTHYRFEDGPVHVTAEGGWDHTPGFSFDMAYTVVFERATADFTLGRPKPLVLARDGEARAVELPAGTGYDGEVRHLLQAIASGARDLRASVEDAVGLTAMLEAEQESLRSGAPVSL